MNTEIFNKYLPIINIYYPECTSEKVALLDEGHDHYVFLVNKMHAFRFPRTDAHGKQDHVINAFSQKFAPISPVPIQKMAGHVDPKTSIKYQTYDFIPGVTLSRELAASLTEGELIEIAKDMGGFLSRLHTFPLDQAREMQMDELVSPPDYGEYFKDFLKKDRIAFFSLLSEKEQVWIDQSIEAFYNLTREHSFPFTVTHSDMLAEHILIDEITHRLSGVIDFSLRIADPANDFKVFDGYGEAFLKAVYENYLPVDEYFDKRRAFYAGNLPGANLYQAIERNDIKMVNQYLRELKEYISNHPST